MTTETIQKLQDALREVRERYHALILEEIRNSGRTYRQIAETYGCSEGLVYTISRINGLSRAGQTDEDAPEDKAHE